MAIPIAISSWKTTNCAIGKWIQTVGGVCQVLIRLFHSIQRFLGNRASMSSVSTPQSPPPEMHPKGGITLTPNTIIKRSKTLFGSSIIDIKSEYDAITLCAYNSADDSAWFSELYHALERVKKVYRDENSNGHAFLP